METGPRINYKTDRATDNYIKMCKKAEEIQELRNYKEGGWFYTKHGYHRISDDFIYFITDEDVTDNWITRINGVWLPTQEQLQEMIFSKKLTKYDIGLYLSNFGDWAMDEIYSFSSVNELWLAFVMKEKFNKTWTGKDWVSIETTNKTDQKV